MRSWTPFTTFTCFYYRCIKKKFRRQSLYYALKINFAAEGYKGPSAHPHTQLPLLAQYIADSYVAAQPAGVLLRQEWLYEEAAHTIEYHPGRAEQQSMESRSVVLDYIAHWELVTQ